MEDSYEYAERKEQELQELLALERTMVGNAAPPPSNEPRPPTTWGDIGAMILAALAFVVACVGFVVWIIADILGYI